MVWIGGSPQSVHMVLCPTCDIAPKCLGGGASILGEQNAKAMSSLGIPCKPEGEKLQWYENGGEKNWSEQNLLLLLYWSKHFWALGAIGASCFHRLLKENFLKTLQIQIIEKSNIIHGFANVRNPRLRKPKERNKEKKKTNNFELHRMKYCLGSYLLAVGGAARRGGGRKTTKSRLTGQ